jgi:hydroxymethylpyrimidine kinase / phosphomethylpyrimidine kinase / thiamine-phosphate diphosphorylase
MDPETPPMRLIVNNDSSRLAMKGVYLITDQGSRLLERVREALDGGVTFLQYRNKERDFDRKLNEGWDLRQLCRSRGVTFIVNDDLQLARELEADGIHLGQEDGSVATARRVLGKEKIIGVSTHDLDEALQAEAEGADYIGFGAIYPTFSKEVDHMPGPEGLAAIRGRVRLPVVAIGGINRDNASGVIDAGADAVAVISAVLGNSRPALAAAELNLLFNRKTPHPRGTVLTVAGSDSGGGAGIQADLKTITLLGSYGASVITALTAQNTRGVSAIHPVPAEFVCDQMDAVLSDLPVDVVKTGMLLSAEIIAVLAQKITEYRRRMTVVDPVMTAKGGASLLDRNALDTFRDLLLPLSYLLTPNIPEAEQLTGITIRNEEDMEAAAKALVGMGARNVLVKGGHLTSGDSVDILFDGGGFSRFSSPRILTRNSHGTGCTFASAVAALLAQGEPLPRAVAGAKTFITSAIRLAQPMGKGHGPVNHYLAARMQAEA